MTDDSSILDRISALVAEEHELRDRHATHGPGDTTADDERDRLRALEVELDQCWDLLRQRRAKREFGDDPGAAQARPSSTVEGYLN